MASITNGPMTWTDIQDPNSADMALLARDHGFHSLDLEDCLSARQVTKIEDHGDHLFITLSFPDQTGQGLISSRQVSMFVGRDYLISMHPSSFRALSALFQSCRDDQKQRNEIMRSPAYLVYTLVDTMVDALFLILDDVQTSLGLIEAVVFNERKSSANAINAARRQIAVLRRIVYPLGLHLQDLVKAQKDSEEDLSIYFSDLRHKILRASGEIEEMKEMVEIYKDTDFVTSSNRTNNVLAILTILFTLTIPATVISSIYGMNVPLPGGWNFGVTGPLDYFGPYTSLLFIFIAMLIPAIIMVLYFKRVGWF
jgi:magnesium transporter